MPLPKTVDFSSEPFKKLPNYIANRYLREKILGSGTFGNVYLVNDIRQPSPVFRAAKEISFPIGEEDQWVDAVKEARILSNLYHPHVVQLCDAVLENASFYIIMEYCEHGTLEEYINKAAVLQEYFSAEHVTCWLLQLADALSYIHSRRIIHRDLKSRNIFLISNQSESWADLKIGDFGISRVLFTSTEKATTMIGTPFYLSPELLQQLPYDKKSDSWALGCLFFEMCALANPFTTNQSFADLMNLIVYTEPDYSAFPENLQHFQPLCSRLLRKLPSARPSAEEVLYYPCISLHIEDRCFRNMKGGMTIAETWLLHCTVNQPAPPSATTMRKVGLDLMLNMKRVIAFHSKKFKWPPNTSLSRQQ